MKALTNQRSLISAYNKGEIERVAIDLNRYFDIESDKEWTIGEDLPRYEGNWRKRTYLVKHSKGVTRWTTEWHNGQVKSVECVFEI